MTYCVAVKVQDGLVFAADTRTSAGVDDVRTYNKMHVFETPGERVFVVLSAGNLATTQTVLRQLKQDLLDNTLPMNLNKAQHMFDAADYLGGLSVRAQKESDAHSQYSSVDFRTTLILGGQILGEDPALYLIYPEGNCISASPETPYIQIGESKYGKPIMDRIIRPQISLEDAARCSLVSLDSTMKSNLTVGPPVDLAVLPRNALRISQRERFDLDTPYFYNLKRAWGELLVESFTRLPKFDWELQQQQQQLQQPFRNS